jgi:hypothetical protein
MPHRYLASNGIEIEEKQLVRDLGVLMSIEATFNDHIKEIVAQSKQRMEWIWRTFRTREAGQMMTLFSLQSPRAPNL